MTPEHKRRIWKAVRILALLNLVGFFVVDVLVGDAMKGYVSDGHYYVWNKFYRPVYVEVSRTAYRYAWWLEISSLTSFTLVWVSAAMLSDHPPTIAGLRA